MGRIRKAGNTDVQAVFSTDGGRIADVPAARPCAGSTDGVVRVSRTTAGRRGKTVTLVTGIPPSQLTDIGTELKRLCGSGGSVKDGVIEVQGDHRDRIATHLGSRFTLTVSGG